MNRNNCPFMRFGNRRFSNVVLLGLQKDSFCLPKGLHLHSKRTPFESQKESFLKEGGVSPTPSPSPVGRGVI